MILGMNSRVSIKVAYCSGEGRGRDLDVTGWVGLEVLCSEGRCASWWERVTLNLRES